jgi:hypothetical protein
MIKWAASDADVPLTEEDLLKLEVGSAPASKATYLLSEDMVE